MGTWGHGPFESDGAADFLDAVAASPSRAITDALKTIVRAAPSTYLDVDEGSAAWAACELVALSFGRGDLVALDDRTRDHLDRVKPSEAQRVLALEASARLGDRASSELAALWADDGSGAQVAVLESLVQWVEDHGVGNAVRVLAAEAAGQTGYGRPNEASERRSYALAALAALWIGGLSNDEWCWPS